MTTLVRAPALDDVDLYADDVLVDPRDTYARIRDAGPVVWLPRHRMYAIGRYEEVRAALRDDDGFRSGNGVAANPIAGALGKDTTLNSDDEDHTRRRRVLMRSLGAKALASVEAPLRTEADALVDELLRRSWFEATQDFAARLPSTVVAQLVGVGAGSDRLLRWAAATFDGLGPMNSRAWRAPRGRSASSATRGRSPRRPSCRAAGRRRCSTRMRPAS